MSAAPAGTTYTIPYEKQSQADGNRTCGAACLSMVYRSLGKEVPQAEIWEGIAKVNRFGSLASTTHLMVGDALKRGFDAVAFRARHPLFALRCCREANIRVILNHRLQPELPTGHYSVLVDIGDRDVTLHDPYFGASRRLSHGELMQLWDPGTHSEIVGETMIAIAPRQPGEAACEICQTRIPSAVQCPRCGKPVPLRPATGIGCVGEGCVVRSWLNVCCPSCDYMWNFTDTATAPPETAPTTEETENPGDLFQFGKLFGEIDKFCATIAAIPVAAANPVVMKQLEFMKAGKQRLTEAAAKQMAGFQEHLDQRAAARDKVKQAKEARGTPAPSPSTPAPALDGNALVQGLLKNTGIIQ